MILFPLGRLRQAVESPAAGSSEPRRTLCSRTLLQGRGLSVDRPHTYFTALFRDRRKLMFLRCCFAHISTTSPSEVNRHDWLTEESLIEDREVVISVPNAHHLQRHLFLMMLNIVSCYDLCPGPGASLSLLSFSLTVPQTDARCPQTFSWPSFWIFQVTYLCFTNPILLDAILSRFPSLYKLAIVLCCLPVCLFGADCLQRQPSLRAFSLFPVFGPFRIFLQPLDSPVWIF